MINAFVYLQTVVLCHTWLACQEETNFASADEFLPERWLQNGELSRTSPFLVIPFGFGRRVCPGKRFAEQQMHLALAKVTVFIHLFDYISTQVIETLQKPCNVLK
jgi:ecdysone 20-monooxygenase